MKTTLITLALALTSAASLAMTTESAMTGSANPSSVELVRDGDTLVPKYAMTSKTTRADVLAELRASQARMDWVADGDMLVPRSTFKGTKTVAEVRAEYFAARDKARLSARLHGYGDSSN